MIMDGIVFTPHSPISLKYWDMLKDLNSTVKMELAAMLTTSLAYKENVDVEPEMTEEERKQELLSLAGCWADDPEDAARMEAAIKDGRKNVFTTSQGARHGVTRLRIPPSSLLQTTSVAPIKPSRRLRPSRRA